MSVPEFLGKPFVSHKHITSGDPTKQLIFSSWQVIYVPWPNLFITSIACYNYETSNIELNVSSLEREDGGAFGALGILGSRTVAASAGALSTAPQELVGVLFPRRLDYIGKIRGLRWESDLQMHVSCTTLTTLGAHVVLTGFEI